MAEIIATGVQRSGKNSRVSVSGTALAKSKWNVNYTGMDLDTVNFESDGLDEGIIGVEGLDWSAGGDFDAGTNPLDEPPGLFPRDDLQDLLLYVNVADDTFWDMPYARVLSATNSSDVKGKVAFDASGKSQGDFDVPTGSV